MNQIHHILLTGATSGIGMATASLLTEKGHEVYGIGRDFSKTDRELLERKNFHSITCDLLLEDAPEHLVRSLKHKADIDVLINNAGTASYGLHEMIRPEEIRKMLRTNLEVPMILTQLLLSDFKREGGMIINVASVTAVASANPHGAAYGASKAGLLSFSRSIFEEARKCDVRVTTILPDMTKTDLYRDADFDVDASEGAYLEPEEVAKAILYAMERPAGVDLPEIMLRPQYHRIAKKVRN